MGRSIVILFLESANRPPAIEAPPTACGGGRTVGRIFSRWTARLIMALLIWAAAAPAGAQSAQTHPEQSAAATAEGQPFHFEGVVLCYDVVWHQMFVCDGSETHYFAAQGFPSPFQPGDYVKVTGVTAFDGSGVVITNLHGELLGKKALPSPRHIELRELPDAIGQWIEVEGQVRRRTPAGGAWCWRSARRARANRPTSWASPTRRFPWG